MGETSFSDRSVQLRDEFSEQEKSLFDSIYNNVKWEEIRSIKELKMPFLGYLISIIIGFSLITINNIFFEEADYSFTVTFFIVFPILKAIFILVNFETSILYVTWAIYLHSLKPFSTEELIDGLRNKHFNSLNEYVEFSLYRYQNDKDTNNQGKLLENIVVKKQYSPHESKFHDIFNVVSKDVIHKIFIICMLIFFLLYFIVQTWREDLLHYIIITFSFLIDSISVYFNKYHLSENYYLSWKTNKIMIFPYSNETLGNYIYLNNGSFLSYLELL